MPQLESLYNLHFTVRNDLTAISTWCIKGDSVQAFLPTLLRTTEPLINCMCYSQLKLQAVPVVSRYSTGSVFLSLL